MRMYLDDLRTPEEEFDFIVRSYDEAIEVIKKYGIPNFLSFDNDLIFMIFATILFLEKDNN